MKYYILLLILTGTNTCLFAQSSSIDSGTFLLHKFAQNIGKEKYVATDSAGIHTYKVDFKYIDRGSPVSLQATLKLNSTLHPRAYIIKGGTSRFSQLDDSVTIKNKSAFITIDSVSTEKNVTGNEFTVAGYSPATTQMLLIQFWKKQGKPANIPTLPEGNIQIKKDGSDTFLFNDKKLMLERYVITGLIWGNELLWTDAKGQLYCLITNDAEGDKQEMIFEPYESLLSGFIAKAAVYGMKLFTNNAKPAFQKHKVIAITNGNVVDVVNNRTLNGVTVLIENGVIKNVGHNVTVPSDAFIIDAKGKTILPGLFDMHAHFEQAEWGPAYLAAGVTTVRDCGNEFVYINAVKNAIDSGAGIGPQILKAGIIDGKGAYALGIVQATTKEEAIAEVDRYKQNGFAQIKIYSSVKPAIVKAICDEAHKQGFTVTGHIPNNMTLMQGVDSGMDMVNHIQYVFSVLKKHADRTINFDDSTNKAVFDFIKSHHVVIDPTLGVFELSLRSLNESIENIEPNFKTLPQPLQVIFTNTGLPEKDYESYGKRVMEIFKVIFKKLYDEGVPLVAGTDMGFPGYSLDRELEIYVDCGLTPMQAIQLATISPARVMNIEKNYGSIEQGKNADLIIIDGNPLQNIRDIRKVKTVIKDGMIYDPVQLHKIAGFQ